MQLANSSLVASVIGGDQAKSQRFGQLLDYFGDYGLTAEDFRSPEQFRAKFLERQREFLAGAKSLNVCDYLTHLRELQEFNGAFAFEREFALAVVSNACLEDVSEDVELASTRSTAATLRLSENKQSVWDDGDSSQSQEGAE